MDMNTQTKCPRCGTRYSQSETATTICPQCAFAAAVTSPLEIEAEADHLLGHLSGLAHVERLGRGGMGVVYRARQTRLERDVAVKVISSDYASDPDFQARFQQEARILASLDHPNIVAIHDCGIEGGLEYFVMEFVEGETVRHLLERGALKDPLRIALDVSNALAYAHERGVIHRDVKPENILLRADGRVKVVDFGIARIGMGAPRLTVTDAVVGTPAYMAPEQRENTSAVDHRVDVYALGLLMAEMLTGKGPTEGALELPGVDQATKELILRATERDPARRYQTMKEMSAAIRALVEPEGDGGAPPRLPLRERLARLAASRLFWVLATGAVFQVVFLLARLVDTLPPDPKAIFERLVRAKHSFDGDKALREMKDERIRDSVDALLGSEASGTDAARAWTAVRAAYDLHRADAIPPDVRVRVMLHWGDKVDSIGTNMTEWFPDEMSNYVTPALRESGPVPQGVIDAYVRRLPGLLDEGSTEADWSRVLELVRDLGKDSTHALEFGLSWWSEAHGSCDAASPSPQEALARRLKIAWPLDAKAARALELELRSDDPPRSAYATALLLRWRRTGRKTLPYRSVDMCRPGSPEPGIEETRALLSDAAESARWEAHGVIFLTIAGAPIEMDPASGDGPVRAKLSHVVPADAETPALHIGVATVGAQSAKREGSAFDLSVEGDLVRGKDGACRFTGTTGQRFGGGWGSFTGPRDCRDGEAAVLSAGLVGGSTDGLRSGSFTLLVPEPATTGDASQRWRAALAAAIEHEVVRTGIGSQLPLGEMVAIAAWTPLPEAAKTLSALWERHATLTQPSHGLGHASPAVGDLVGAALLMIGDARPLEDGGLVKRLPPEVVLRIRLFSPSAAIRRAATGGEKAIESRQDADAVEARLGDLGEADAPLAARIAELRAAESSPIAGALWRYFAWLAAAIVLGCLLPWRPMHATALAHALAFLGLSLRFVTVDIGGHVWFPAVGDLLIVVSAFLYGGWGLRSLAVALAVSGVLGFMHFAHKLQAELDAEAPPEAATFERDFCAACAILGADARGQVELLRDLAGFAKYEDVRSAATEALKQVEGK